MLCSGFCEEAIDGWRQGYNPGGEAILSGVRREPLLLIAHREDGRPHLADAEFEAGLDRAQRNARLRRDLALAETAVVGEVNGLALRFGQGDQDALKISARSASLASFSTVS